MRRLLVNLLTALSLLLFVAGGMLWARSYFVQHVLVFALPSGPTASVVHSTAGSFVVMGHQNFAFPTSVDQFTEEVSVFVDGAGALVTFIHHYDRDFGLSGIVFPQWVAMAPFALLPAARLEAVRLCRARPARGLPGGPRPGDRAAIGAPHLPGYGPVHSRRIWRSVPAPVPRAGRAPRTSARRR